jgi:hypothetical protein
VEELCSNFGGFRCSHAINESEGLVVEPHHRFLMYETEKKSLILGPDDHLRPPYFHASEFGAMAVESFNLRKLQNSQSLLAFLSIPSNLLHCVAAGQI